MSESGQDKDNNHVIESIDFIDVKNLKTSEYIDRVHTLNKDQFKKVKIYDVAVHCGNLARLLEQIQPYGFFLYLS